MKYIFLHLQGKARNVYHYPTPYTTVWVNVYHYPNPYTTVWVNVHHYPNPNSFSQFVNGYYKPRTNTI